MKGCICAILLLICGMIHSTQTSCLFGNTEYKHGVYTVRSCKQMFCDVDNSIILKGCSMDVKCPPGLQPVVVVPEQSSLHFPDCCPAVVCGPQSLYLAYKPFNE